MICSPPRPVPGKTNADERGAEAVAPVKTLNMPLQDLTPQLRTRLSRLESAVGWFVILAALLLVAGFVYYVWHTAQRRGWFQEKVLFSTFVNTATGIKAGDPVKLMGFPIGEVQRVAPNPPDFQYGNITIFFTVRRDANNYCGYLWSDSKVRVAAGDFLGNRTLELVKGRTGIPLFRVAEPAADPRSKITGVLDEREFQRIAGLISQILTDDRGRTAPLEREITNLIHQVDARTTEYARWLNTDLAAATEALVMLELYQANPARFYQPYSKSKSVFIKPNESAALTERLERVVDQAEKALPNILGLTNQITQVLNNAIKVTASLDNMIADARPAVTNASTLVARLDQSVRDLRPVLTNLAVISEYLKQPQGGLGEWLIPTNINRELEAVLKNANTTLSAANKALANTDTNVASLVEHVNLTLENLAAMTSNLNRQVEANTNILGEISSLVRDTDSFVQGLRRHWLLRSAFKTNAPPKTTNPATKTKPLFPPKLRP
jgi:ABC-type transporter Mla subunit MlaD